MNGNIGYIVDKYSDMIYRTAFAYLGSAADAEDIVSDVLMKYFDSERGGQQFSNDQHIKAWLLRVTVNTSKDILKSYRVKNSISLDGANEAAADISLAETSDMKLDLESALNSLPYEYRIVLFLYYYQEYSTKEIAELLGTPKNTIVSRLARGRKALKQKLKGYSTDLKGVTNNYA